MLSVFLPGITRRSPIALSQSALSELLDAIRAGEGTDVLGDAMALILQELIELEAAQVIGAGRY
jgi:hypothetical protein